jgi:hypothetical protein
MSATNVIIISIIILCVCMIVIFKVIHAISKKTSKNFDLLIQQAELLMESSNWFLDFDGRLTKLEEAEYGRKNR